MNAFLRKIGTTGMKFIWWLESPLDRFFLANDVPSANSIAHLHWRKRLADLGNKEGMRILELGSREVTGPSSDRALFSKATYLGFDMYPGRNVDVVGDAHRLSTYFKKDERFDIIYSSACFEHFAMPWVVATEIAKSLKVGGYVFIETVFSFPSHERPWNFFLFSDMALRSLFSPALGFQCIEAGMCNPIVGRFSSLADRYLRYQPLPGLYCHSAFLGKKVADIENFDWSAVDQNAVVDGTTYPPPSKISSTAQWWPIPFP